MTKKELKTILRSLLCVFIAPLVGAIVFGWSALEDFIDTVKGDR